MKPASNLEEFLALTGDSIDRIFEAVTDVMERMHYCEICGRTPLPVGHPHCLMCESPLMIEQCICGAWFCKTGCKHWHVHPNDSGFDA